MTTKTNYGRFVNRSHAGDMLSDVPAKYRDLVRTAIRAQPDCPWGRNEAGGDYEELVLADLRACLKGLGFICPVVE